MKIKTKGKCLKCNEVYSPSKAGVHLLRCTCQANDSSTPMVERYLIQVSSAAEPNVYWMFIAISKNSPLKLLDQFLRDTWLECCGHLSEFTIGNRSFMSHTESGNPSQSMKNQIGQLLSPGAQFEYVYDMGSSTDLVLQVTETISAHPQKKIMLLMQNEPPAFPCKSCKLTADTICSLCGETICSSCQNDHSCAVKEEDTYMLMPLVNSPRAGVCGYDGEY